MSPLQVKGKMIMNSLSLFVAISGIIILFLDIFNITISHFFKVERLDVIKTPMTDIDIYDCEPANPAEKSSPYMPFCHSVRSVFLVSVKFHFIEEVWHFYYEHRV